ncbi:MAG: D-aminoacyl-tRNA deacylase [Planctomycetota bacterium]|nr:D-aminoacyl-tRNA deacylase [Planctomycetota bacterium]
MRGCVQRVTRASVTVDRRIEGQIAAGLLVLLGVDAEDTPEDIDWMVQKVLNLRIFSDDADQMNRSLLDVRGELLVVSQFTLFGDCRKGRRPSFTQAAPPEKAEEFYERFIRDTKASGLTVASGTFRADMQVELVNDGPVTLWLDSRAGTIS